MVRTPWWFPLIIGLICLALGFPAEGVLGVFFGLTGPLLIWIAYCKFRRDSEEWPR